MKKFYLIALMILSCRLFPQVFEGSTGIVTNDGNETYFPNAVSGLSGSLTSTYGLEAVYIELNHADLSQLRIYLISPSGIMLDLVGCYCVFGNGFGGTTFKNGSFQSITTGTAPFSGTFSPICNFGRVNNNKAGNGTWQLVVKDFVPDNIQGTLVRWNLQFSSSPSQPVVFQSSNLPLVYINSNNQQITETGDVIIDFGVMDNGAARNSVSGTWNNYNGKAACHIRGSSSTLFEKKGFKIELRDGTGQNQIDASILGMPAESDWALVPPYIDKSLMRQAISQYMFQQMGHYSPRYRFVELILNGEYFGVYLLMEHIKHGKDRVNIQKMTELDNQFPYVTGGYIIQIDRDKSPGWYSKYPGVTNGTDHFYYQYCYPHAGTITPTQQNYIKAVLDTFETVMQSPDFADPVNGYRKFIDETSFIDFFIVNEYSKNIDAYRLSTYLYKDNITDGGKIHAGPVWDYDLAWHNSTFGNTFDERFWECMLPGSPNPSPTWWQRFIQDPAFNDKFYCRYHTLRLNQIKTENLWTYIDNTAALLSESQDRNFKQFPVMGAFIYCNPQNQSTATFQSEVDDLKRWVNLRGAWLDANVPGYCADVGIAVNGQEIKGLLSFPNPFTEQIHLKSEKEEKLQAWLMNSAGSKVFEKVVETKQAKDLIINTSALEPGVYILGVSDGQKIYYNKMIKYRQ